MFVLALKEQMRKIIQKLIKKFHSQVGPYRELQPKLTSRDCPQRPQIMNVVVPSDTRLLILVAPGKIKTNPHWRKLPSSKTIRESSQIKVEGHQPVPGQR